MICIALVAERRTAISAVLAVVVLAASAACSSGGPDRSTVGANPTVATEPPTTTTTNPYAVPAVIDVAYVNRVLAGLDAAMGDVTRLILRTRTIPREAYDRMRAIYDNDERLQLAIDSFQSDMRRNFAGYRPDPGDKKTTVTELLTVTRPCVFVRVTRDYTAVGQNSSSADTQWIALRRLDTSRDPHGFNKTQWAFSYEGYTDTRSQPSDPCVS